jgi:hypothetical protein
LLVSWCAGGRYDMTYSDEDHGRSRKPSDDRKDRVLGDRAIERSDDAVCGLHLARGD